MHELVDLLRSRDVAKVDVAEVAQRRCGRQSIADESDDWLRQQDLTPMGYAHDPRCPVNDAPEEIAFAALDCT